VIPPARIVICHYFLKAAKIAVLIVSKNAEAFFFCLISDEIRHKKVDDSTL
jgi:hypothetical protein